MIEDLIAHIAETEPPYAGDDLAGFMEELEFALFDTDRLTETRVMHTDNLLCMVAVSAVATEQVESLNSVEETLNTVWQHALLSYFQATSRTLYKEAIALRFVTSASGGFPFVSGIIVVRGAPLARLIAAHEQMFGYQLPNLPPEVAALIG